MNVKELEIKYANDPFKGLCKFISNTFGPTTCITGESVLEWCSTGGIPKKIYLNTENERMIDVLKFLGHTTFCGHTLNFVVMEEPRFIHEKLSIDVNVYSMENDCEAISAWRKRKIIPINYQTPDEVVDLDYEARKEACEQHIRIYELIKKGWTFDTPLTLTTGLCSILQDHTDQLVELMCGHSFDACALFQLIGTKANKGCPLCRKDFCFSEGPKRRRCETCDCYMGEWCQECDGCEECDENQISKWCSGCDAQVCDGCAERCHSGCRVEDVD